MQGASYRALEVLPLNPPTQGQDGTYGARWAGPGRRAQVEARAVRCPDFTLLST